MMNSTGRMNRISGKITLTGICIAFSSARWRRLIRISWAWVDSTSAMETPCSSACTIARTNRLRSCTWVRSPSAS
ncbi:hypothetical protein BH24ACT8_BH24ACT8_01170 [soil metagenome]